MQLVALGKIVVTTAGTAVTITAAMITAAGGTLPPNGCVEKIEFRSDPAMVGTTSYVKTAAGVIVAPMLKPSGGNMSSWSQEAPNGGNVIPVLFAVDVATSGDGVFVNVWID